MAQRKANKGMETSKLTGNDLMLKIMSETARLTHGSVPPGWKNVTQLAREFQRSEVHAAKILLNAVKVGAMERRKFFDGHWHKYYYKPIA